MATSLIIQMDFSTHKILTEWSSKKEKEMNMQRHECCTFGNPKKAGIRYRQLLKNTDIPNGSLSYILKLDCCNHSIKTKPIV
jgi:hypothetical protein